MYPEQVEFFRYLESIRDEKLISLKLSFALSNTENNSRMAHERDSGLLQELSIVRITSRPREQTDLRISSLDVNKEVQGV